MINTSTEEPPTEAPLTPTFLWDISNSTPRGCLEAAELSCLQASSCSGENVTSKLVKELFSADERLTSNVRGVLGKKYDQKLMAYIYDPIFQSYPSSLKEKKPAWAKCIKAIDSGSRVFCRKTKGKETEHSNTGTGTGTLYIYNS